jgi:hypothetical protein
MLIPTRCQDSLRQRACGRGGVPITRSDGLTPGADKASDVRAYENNSPVRSSRRTRLSLIAAFNPLLTKIALMDYLGRNYLVSEQLFRAASSTNRRQK